MTALLPPLARDTPVLSSSVVCRGVGIGSRPVLTDLRKAMKVAQRVMMVARRPPDVPVQLTAVRGDYLPSVLAYERALSTFALPVPPRLRDEARLLRRLTSSVGPSRSSGRCPSRRR